MDIAIGVPIEFKREIEIVLETPRLYIRELSVNDLMELYAICSDEVLMQFVGDGKPLSIEQVREWLSVTENNYKTKGFGNYAVVNKSDNEMIGYCGLVYSKNIDKIELIYALKKQYWNLGLATEAGAKMIEFGLDRIKLDEIYASIDPENKASENILGKLGFSFAFGQNDEFGYSTHYYRITAKQLPADSR
ncbi:GCN5-related N-acetyltransferase [Dyadobacter fermentans DSM 18053]|uniref:GCN5-related N-acetyltransferase n=1 Tax=Dyadobacter fermentans (strain ATCC 700827 / DSM 18053 / CIP 107007 / KCTC 52180 / NS114) TaxID=471854 RepID=C6VUN6_DYAFD|nr:GCN5-related N-acetyltransferase [Dyadobacter fermentans DSM 18053]